MLQRTIVLAAITTIGLSMAMTIKAPSAKEQSTFARGNVHSQFYRGEKARAQFRTPKQQAALPRIKSAAPPGVPDLVFIKFKSCARTSGHVRNSSYGACLPPPP
jgi:hypothetical protein